jgi:cytochrome c-type biogenesis protein CcmH/NrfF/cytochrome c-type biogenesis protein CcmH/NrfG
MMTDSLKRLIRVALIVVALAIIVAGLWPTSSDPPTVAERTSAVASQIRCPFCNGESIAEATSQVARDLEVVIEDQVRAGMTDDEIYAYFAERYGEAILTAPPLRGWGWGLWALPLLALGVGGAVIWRTRRSGPAESSAAGDGALEQTRVETAIAQVDRDLEESRRQYEAGEIDGVTLTALTTTYENERAELVVTLAAFTAGSTAESAAEPPESEGVVDADRDEAAAAPVDGRGPGRRRLVGAAVLVIGALAVTVFAVGSADRSGNDATAGIVDAPAIDLANVTTEQLEAVVAANPDVIGMRLALAEVLMQEDDLQRAVFHFGQVLERERHPEALAWLGFISFQVNEPETAEDYLVEALELQPNYPQAQWWLANVRYVGLGDVAGAIAPLEALLVFDNVPDDIREAAVALLAQARDER